MAGRVRSLHTKGHTSERSDPFTLQNLPKRTHKMFRRRLLLPLPIFSIFLIKCDFRVHQAAWKEFHLPTSAWQSSPPPPPFPKQRLVFVRLLCVPPLVVFIWFKNSVLFFGISNEPHTGWNHIQLGSKFFTERER